MASSDKAFSSSYFLLKPEEVGFFDLIHILFSTKFDEGRIGDSSKSKGTVDDADDEEYFNFRRRWLIFVSILGQKFLQLVSKPLAFLGSEIEMFLNLLSHNRNVFVLIFNFIRGKVVKPDKTSATFISFIGNMDKRVELDSNIGYDEPNYLAALSMMASKASYENTAYIQTIVNHQWKMEFLGFFDFWNDYQEKATTQAFLLRDDKFCDRDTIVVAFRGTEPFDADAWCSDFDISWYEHSPKVGKIHVGFMKALGLQKNAGWPKELEQEDDKPAVAYYAIRDMLKKLLTQNEQARYIVTGHSLGAALAILFPAVLALHDETWLLDRLQGVYTFGQPRVGDERFGEFMKKTLKDHGVRYYRFVYGNDMVARLPYDDKALMFKHFGTCLYYNRHYEVKVVTEEPNKNYFSPLGAIPMMMNAFCELIRSFTIVYSKGPNYKEGSFLRVFRIIGLVVPGVPAHSTQDYVNATRLGSPDVFLPLEDVSYKVDFEVNS